MIEDFEVLFKTLAYVLCHDRTVQRSLRSDRPTRILGIARAFGPPARRPIACFHDSSHSRPVYQASSLRLCRSGFAGKSFTKQFRLQLPRKRSGHEGVHDAVQPAWNDSGAVFEQTAEALRYALLDAHRFHRQGLRIEAELFEHCCVRKPGCQYSDVDTYRLELILKRLAKAVHIRLRGSVIRHTGNAVFRTPCPP